MLKIYSIAENCFTDLQCTNLTLGLKYVCMEVNVGLMDQKVRIAAGAILGLISLGILGSYVPGPEIVSPILGVLSIILLVTGYFRKCFIYQALGRDTTEE